VFFLVFIFEVFVAVWLDESVCTHLKYRVSL
jgi:hypothetical protein